MRAGLWACGLSPENDPWNKMALEESQKERDFIALAVEAGFPVPQAKFMYKYLLLKDRS